MQLYKVSEMQTAITSTNYTKYMVMELKVWTMEREIKPGVLRLSEEEVIEVLVGFDGVVEMGGNEGGVLDYGFPSFGN
jgi:hypothetical protein